MPCGARQSGPTHKLGPQETAGLRHMRRKSPASPVLLGGAAGAPKSKTRTAQCNSRCVHDVWLLTFPPVGDAEKRSADGRCPGPMSEAHVLCGPSLGPGPLARASQGSRVATVTSGSPFLGPVFDRRKSPEGIGEAKEGTRSPQGSETTQPNRKSLPAQRGTNPMDSRFRGNDESLREKPRDCFVGVASSQ